jgi:hypothetical protein
MASSTERANNSSRPKSRNSPSRTFKFARLAIVATCLVLATSHTVTASAQASPAATRSFSLTPYVLGSYIRPDYYKDPGTYGFGTGLDVGFPHMIGPFQPAAEIRITGVSDTFANEYTYTIGAKMTALVHGIHPYATFLGGLSTLYLNYPSLPNRHGVYVHDSGLMLSFGGGAEVDMGRAFQLRLDYSRQMSSQGDYYVFGAPDIHPDAFSLGINYRIQPRGTAGK